MVSREDLQFPREIREILTLIEEALRLSNQYP